MDIPSRAPDAAFAIAVTQSKNGSAPFPGRQIRDAGWEILDPLVEAGNASDYRTFIQRSSGEFSVAKEAYVKGRTGWFSGRSASYLASGRPVIAQNTGWSDVIPEGRGLFAFSDEESAVAALEAVVADHRAHAGAAREIALEFFDSTKVLGSLIERART
jgi:glycosyltransferase involved in cell wall biosynthesis